MIRIELLIAISASFFLPVAAGPHVPPQTEDITPGSIIPRTSEDAHAARTIPNAPETIPGITRPARQVELSAPFDATLLSLHVSEGDHVEAGELIATMDDRVARASVALAQQEARRTAAIERASAELKHARATRDRLNEASREGGANIAEVQNAEASVERAEAELRLAEEAHEAAKLGLGLAEARLAEHQIRAPFSGTVLRLHTENGTTLRVGDLIAEIANLTRQRVDIYLGPTAAATIERDATYELAIGSEPAQVVEAVVRFVEPRVDPASGTIRVVFEIATSPSVPPVGLIARPAPYRIDESSTRSAEAGHSGS